MFYFSRLIFLMGLFFSMPLYGKQRRWKHCTHYLSTFPSYKDYKAPNYILKEGCPWGNWVTFEQKIIAIEYKVGKWSNPIELFESRDFLAIYHYPGYYCAAAIDYLSSVGPTDNQKNLYLCSKKFTLPILIPQEGFRAIQNG